jgi:predicted RNA methylase
VLDLGTGSGVLAIAAAKLGPVSVLATDIDPVATKSGRCKCAPQPGGRPGQVRHRARISFDRFHQAPARSV